MTSRFCLFFAQMQLWGEIQTLNLLLCTKLQVFTLPEAMIQPKTWTLIGTLDFQIILTGWNTGSDCLLDRKFQTLTRGDLMNPVSASSHLACVLTAENSPKLSIEPQAPQSPILLSFFKIENSNQLDLTYFANSAIL